MSNGTIQAGANGQHTLKVRTALRAGGFTENHNETLRVRTALRAGGFTANHNETLQVRTALRAGGLTSNHNETLRVRAGLVGGGVNLNHNESISHEVSARNVFMRRDLRTTGAGEGRLELMVVRTGLRVGRMTLRRNRR